MMGLGDLHSSRLYELNVHTVTMLSPDKAKEAGFPTHDYKPEQDSEIELLHMLTDGLKEILSSAGRLNTSDRCFVLKISPMDDEPTNPSAIVEFIFSLPEYYPDETPLLNLISFEGIETSDLEVLKEKLEQEAAKVTWGPESRVCSTILVE